MLQHKPTQRYKYYHSSCNCCGRFLDEPSLVSNEDTFDAFLESIHQQAVLKWAINQQPDFDWICNIVTNMTFFVNIIRQHPIDCVGIALPTHIKNNKCIIGLEKSDVGRPYVDNLCLFRCIGLHLGRDVKTIYAQNSYQPAGSFEGITIDDLHRVETVF